VVITGESSAYDVRANVDLTTTTPGSVFAPGGSFGERQRDSGSDGIGSGAAAVQRFEQRRVLRPLLSSPVVSVGAVDHLLNASASSNVGSIAGEPLRDGQRFR